MATESALDATDKSIIRELQVDGRMPYAKLAPLVGLSEAATRQRVNRLIDRHAMQIVAIADPVVLGLDHQAMIGINVDTDVRRIAEKLAEIDAVEYLLITAGRYELMVEIISPDADSFLSLVNDSIRPIEGVRGIEIISCLKLVKQTYNWGTG
jgi:Lrp/AsnC family transcriptional regulator for asnA, asnC and gidA